MALARKTLALVTIACLSMTLPGLGQAPAKKDERGRRELRAALANAHQLRTRLGKLEDQTQRDAAEQEFQKMVVKYRESFPEVPALVGSKARYGKLTLNARGGGFDAIRFRVPSAGQTYQMFWSFVLPGTVEDHNIAGLGILEVDGEGMGLTYPDVKKDVTVPGISLPEPNWWSHYRLYGRKLQAGKEYVLWFDLKSDQPLPIFTRVRIDPIEPPEPPRTPALQAARRTFQASLEALNERYDNDAKASRRRYLAELDKASKAVAKKKNAANRPEIVAEADRANLGDSEAGDPRGFRIIRAETGAGDLWNDVTVPVRSFVRQNRLKVDSADFDFKPDAAFGVGKTLIIVYTVDGKPGVYSAPADRNVDLPPPPAVKTPATK